MIDFKQTTKFLDRVFLQLLRSWIDVSRYELDHICYRVESDEQYEEIQNHLADIWTLISETVIEWRLISVFKLTNSIRYQNRKISFIELPAPKQGSDYKTGFEHVEFVINKKLEVFMWEYPDLEFKTKALSKEINPDISLNFGDISVKFHRNTLEDVIHLEQK